MWPSIICGGCIVFADVGEVSEVCETRLDEVEGITELVCGTNFVMNVSENKVFGNVRAVEDSNFKS